MRRKDREITEINTIVEIIKKCNICRLAFNDTDFPYIIPMNFGFEYENGEIILYFHSANEGNKLELMKKDNRVSFEMDTSHKLITAEVACEYTMEYESVIGNGIAQIIADEDKIHALTILMKNYSSKQSFVFDERMLKAVTVFKIKVNSITAKQLKK